MGLWQRKITVSDDDVTSAALLTTRQSLVPNLLGEHWWMVVVAKLIDTSRLTLRTVPSHHPVLPLGLRLRSPRYPQLPLPVLTQHQRQREFRPKCSVLWGLLPLPFDHLRVDLETLRLPRDLHGWSWCSCRRLPPILAVRGQGELRRLLWLHVRRGHGPVDSRDGGRSVGTPCAEPSFSRGIPSADATATGSCLSAGLPGTPRSDSISHR